MGAGHPQTLASQNHPHQPLRLRRPGLFTPFALLFCTFKKGVCAGHLALLALTPAIVTPLHHAPTCRRNCPLRSISPGALMC